MNAGPQHVIFGTGAIGLATLDALRRRGETARLVNRWPPGPGRHRGSRRRRQRPRLHHRRRPRCPGRLPDPQPALPPMGGTVPRPPGRRLGRRPGQRGPPGQHGERLHVWPPQRPAPDRDPPLCRRTRKGTLRARMACELLAAHQAGNVEVVIGRASDYFGPRGGAQSMLGNRVIPAAQAGKTATVLGDPDQPHTYTYLPDIGEGLATLGEHPEAPGEVWHLPNDPRTRTTRQLVQVIYRLAASPRPSSAALRHSCFEPWASPTPRSGNCSSCSTSSRNLHRRQHQDRHQAGGPRHPAGPGPGHPGCLPHQPSSPPDSGGRCGGSAARPPGGSTSRSRREHQHGCAECNDVRPCDRRYGRPRA